MKAKSLLDPGSMRDSALFQDLVERLRQQLPADHRLLQHFIGITREDRDRQSAGDPD